MKVLISEVTIEDVELDFDRLSDGTKTNYRYLQTGLNGLGSV